MVPEPVRVRLKVLLSATCNATSPVMTNGSVDVPVPDTEMWALPALSWQAHDRPQHFRAMTYSPGLSPLVKPNTPPTARMVAGMMVYHSTALTPWSTAAVARPPKNVTVPAMIALPRYLTQPFTAHP